MLGEKPFTGGVKAIAIYNCYHFLVEITMLVMTPHTFAQTIFPIPDNPIPIFEIFADRFWTLDSTWLDYASANTS